MKVAELAKRDFKRNPLMVVDKSLDKYKNYQIPQSKIDSAIQTSKMNDYKALTEDKNTKP